MILFKKQKMTPITKITDFENFLDNEFVFEKIFFSCPTHLKKLLPFTKFRDFHASVCSLRGVVPGNEKLILGTQTYPNFGFDILVPVLTIDSFEYQPNAIKVTWDYKIKNSYNENVVWTKINVRYPIRFLA